MVVSLHPLSTEERHPAGAAAEAENIEDLGSGDSVCLSVRRGRAGRTRNESKVEKSHSYNEEFDPGSG